MLRAMGPQVLAVDEITNEADASALLQAVGCGVSLLATVHGAEPSELKVRPACRRLVDAGAFSRLVIVENHAGRREYRFRDI